MQRLMRRIYKSGDKKYLNFSQNADVPSVSGPTGTEVFQHGTIGNFVRSELEGINPHYIIKFTFLERFKCERVMACNRNAR